MTNLIDLLQTQQQQLAELASLLESELHLISSRDAETLTKVVDEKSAVLDSIANTDQHISSCFDKDPQLSDDPQIAESMAQIREQVEQCKFRTQINQKAVEQGQLRLQHLRNLLLEARAKESMTYDKSGKTRGGSSGKGISA